MVRKLIISASLAILAVGGCAGAQALPQTDRLPLEGIAAIVNDNPISYSDVRERARLLLLSVGGAQPTAEQVQQITGQALEQLIDERLQIQKADEFEIEVEPESIAGAVTDMAAQSGTDGDALRGQLLNAGVNPASLEDQMRADIAWSRVMSGLYGSRIRVSENQVNDQLKRMRSASKQTQFKVGEIFLYAPEPETRQQALEAANTILGQLNQGADFRVAAQQISSAPTAATGGDMGWVSVEDLSTELASAVTAMEGPGMTQPIEVDNGVYILQVTNRKEPSELTTKVDLKRLISRGGDEAVLKEAIAAIDSCDSVNSVANSKSDLSAGDLDDINVDDLGPEGRGLVMETEVGQPTQIFAASGGLAVMYVCSREDGAEALPSREDIKGSLKNRELGMISERELRNLRREATIIYR